MLLPATKATEPVSAFSRYSEGAMRIVGPGFGLCRSSGIGLSRAFEGKGGRRLDKVVWL